jgi:Spy/CpxP family protein refolding chaperone
VIEKLRKEMAEVLTNEQKLEVQKKLQGFNTALAIDNIKQQLLHSELKLTEQQKQQITELLDDTKNKLDALQSGGKGSAAQLNKLMQEMKTKLARILAAEGTPKKE